MDLAPDEPERQGGKRATRSRNEPIAVRYSSPRKNLDLECDDDVEGPRGVLTASRKLIREEILAGRANPLAGVSGRLDPVRGFLHQRGCEPSSASTSARPVAWVSRGLADDRIRRAFLTPFVADDSAESGDNPSPNWLPALRILGKIANFPDDRHRFGWSGAPSRRTASPDTLDCRCF
jgi:hypothetical protein